MFKEFKEFVQRGNVVDMAVGVIMGAAFGKIVNSLVSDVLMPPIGYLVGGVDFSGLHFKLPAVVVKLPDPAKGGELVEQTLDAVTVNYGKFLQATVDFFIVAICVFLLVKAVNALKRAEKKAPEPTPQEKLLAEIRDLLKTKAEA
jgi:large conductance mechanosensitive channel